VVVRYEDKETLFNPRIVSYSDKAIGIENISVDAAGESLEDAFRESMGAVIGEPMGDPAPAALQSEHKKEVYQPHTEKTKKLFRTALKWAGDLEGDKPAFPAAWADMPALHNLMDLESKGVVGIPNYTYMSVYSNVTDRPDTWPKIWDMARRGEGGRYEAPPPGSTATGLGQLTATDLYRDGEMIPSNVTKFYPTGHNGIGIALEEAVGFVRYIAAAYGDPETAYRMHGKLGTYTNSRTEKDSTKTFREGY